MTKVMVIPNNKENILKVINDCDAFLLGINKFSTNLSFCFNEEEIYELIAIIKEKNKEVFILLNKNYNNKEIEEVFKIMNKLEKLKIDGIFYYDLGILNIYKRGDYNLSLVWAQEHFGTNYKTCDFYKKHGVDYALLSSEITLEEIKLICKNTKVKLIFPAFGYLPMFTSKRELISAYFAYLNIDKQEDYYYMEKENKKYLVFERNKETIVYSSNIINALKEVKLLKECGLDYVLLNGCFIEDDKFLEVVSFFKKAIKEECYELETLINNKFNNIDKGFLYKETLYRVKQ